MTKVALMIHAMLLFAFQACDTEVDTTSDQPKTTERLLEYGECDEVLVDKDGKKVMVKDCLPLPEIVLTDHRNNKFSSADQPHKVMLVYFFFSTCPGICPQMTNQMRRAVLEMKDTSDLIVVAVSIDPERDTPETLAAYAKKFRTEMPNWYFVTGDEQYIHQLGYDYKANVMESDDPASGGFLHSEHFLLIDGNRKLRGFYNGTETDEVNRMIRELPILLKEKDTWKE